MVRVSDVIKLIATQIASTVLTLSLLPIVLYADTLNTNRRVIVSMGDSYSSGEGIEPFYGQDLDISQKVHDPDWLAHRSQYAWSGMLTLPEVGVMSEHRDENWYFVASSGAKTCDFSDWQEKQYSQGLNIGTEYLSPQFDVFSELDVIPDYVTLTLGGNDADFVEILTSAAMTGHYIMPCSLADKLNDVWRRFYARGGIRESLYEVYYNLDMVTGFESNIIVAGYPRLLNPDGGFPFFNSDEAELINTNVSMFNDALEELVDYCRETEMMNIYFVSVEEAFHGHEAYSSEPYLNPVMLLARGQDLCDPRSMGQPVSAYSMHPNYNGACAYARCVQTKIDELEFASGSSNEDGLSSSVADVSDSSVNPLLGSWSPDMSSNDAEVLEFFYDYTYDNNGWLCYYDCHLVDNVEYYYSWGYVSDSSELCVCYPSNYIPYVYASYDISRVTEGVITDCVTGVSYSKVSDAYISYSQHLLDVNATVYGPPIDFSGSWDELEAYMGEWFGDDYSLITDGDRIWAHGYDEDYYNYSIGEYYGDAVYDHDYYNMGAQESARLLYSAIENTTSGNPRLIYIVSGDGNPETTLLVYIDGQLVYDALTDDVGFAQWG